MGYLATELVEKLDHLYRAAGSPSYSALEDAGAPPRSTVSDWLAGKSVPREIDQLLRLVRAFALIAPDLSAELLDERDWRFRLSHARTTDAAGRPSGTVDPGNDVRSPPTASAGPATPAGSPMPDVWQPHADWLLRELRADVHPRLCVVGAVDAGKSTFFRLLARCQPHLATGVSYAYWRLTEDREAVTEAGFLARISERLGLGDRFGAITAVRQLPSLLAELHGDSPIRTVVLILDDWDYAQSLPDGFVHALSLSRFLQLVLSDQMLSNHPIRLGLCYVTRFPSMHYLGSYSRRVKSPEIMRLSGDLPERGFVPARFPFLNRHQATELLAAAGCPPEVHEQALDACGGWAGLLAAAATHVKDAGVWDEHVDRALQDDLEQMLQKTLLPEVMNQAGLTSPDAAWARILRDIGTGTDPQTRYGLPVAFEPYGQGGPTVRPDATRRVRRLPGALRAFLSPPVYLMVDLENLCVRYEHQFRIDPAAFPRGIVEHLRTSLPRAIRHAVEEYEVQPTNVVIAAKSNERAQDVLGPLPPGWRALAPGLQLRRGQHSEADDKVGIAFIAQRAAANPAARFVLVTEDVENLGVLQALDIPSLVVWTPFEATRRVRAYATDTWLVRDNLLPAVGLARPQVNPAMEENR